MQIKGRFIQSRKSNVLKKLLAKNQCQTQCYWSQFTKIRGNTLQLWLWHAKCFYFTLHLYNIIAENLYGMATLSVSHVPRTVCMYVKAFWGKWKTELSKNSVNAIYQTILSILYVNLSSLAALLMSLKYEFENYSPLIPSTTLYNSVVVEAVYNLVMRLFIWMLCENAIFHNLYAAHYLTLWKRKR